MRIKIFVAFALAFVGCCATSRATITNACWSGDGNGAVVCIKANYDVNSSALTMSGDECKAGPAQLNGWVQMDTAEDPTLYLGSAVDNDTTFAWTSYVINVVMPVDFSFVANSLFPYVVNYPPSGPSDWSVASVTAPTLQGSGIYAGKWEGTIDLTGGTPVQVGDELDFGYGIHFAGSTDYSFTQETIPQAVPEPNDLGLATMLLFGGFELVKRLRKKT